MQNKAIFVDRDGTIVSLVYDKETGYIDSIARPEQVRIIDGAAEALARLKAAGYKLYLVSNQPGIAKGRMDEETFWETQRVIDQQLQKMVGVKFDGEYFCFHHPQAVVERYKADCDCRKPKPGLILRAVVENDINVKESFMIGDDILDVKAGSSAGCRTILLSHVNGLLMDLLEVEMTKPTAILRNLFEASTFVLEGPFSKVSP